MSPEELARRRRETVVCARRAPTGDQIEARLALAIAEAMRAVHTLVPLLEETGPGMIGGERFKGIQGAMLQLGSAEIALNRAAGDTRAAFNMFAVLIAPGEPGGE